MLLTARILKSTSAFFRITLFTALVLLVPGLAIAQDAPALPTSSNKLIEILKDDTARNALIADLERAAQIADPEAAEKPTGSIGRRLAEITQSLAEQGSAQAFTTWDQIKSSRAAFSGLTGDEITVLTDALTELALLIILTVGIFLSLRALAMPFYRRMGNRAIGYGLAKITALIGFSTLVDALIVIVAWAAGYIITLTVMGDAGQIDIRQTLYLNAFLVVETIKMTVRLVFSPSAAGLRPLPLSDRAAKSLVRHSYVIISTLGYGQLLVLPIINQSVSPIAGSSVSVLLSVFALIYLITLVFRRQKEVSDWMISRLTAPATVIAKEAEGAEPSSTDLIEGSVETAQIPTQATTEEPVSRRGPLTALVRHWHWGALAYLGIMFFIVMTRPSGAVISALQSSAMVAGAIVVGSIVSNFLSRAIARGIHLPSDINEKLPLLERRINGFVPRILLVIRLVVIVSVTAFSLNAFGLIHVGQWLDSPLGQRLTGTVITLSFIGFVAGMIWLSLNAWVDYRLSLHVGDAPTAREVTLLTLLRNAAVIALVILTMMFCLSEIGLDIGPLLASAGVLGLAIGFGSQKMVQDIIGGVFIQFENAINVGDVITVGGITGTVEKLTVRSVSLRDIRGTYHIIPFSAVEAVSNFTRDFSYFVADVGVAYRENIDEVKQAMLDAYERLRLDPEQSPFLIEDLEWMGLNSFGDSAVMLRARIKTQAGKQWGVGRAYNAHLKFIFDERSIEIPFPHQTIYLGEAKDGTTQAETILKSIAAPRVLPQAPEA